MCAMTVRMSCRYSCRRIGDDDVELKSNGAGVA